MNIYLYAYKYTGEQGKKNPTLNAVITLNAAYEGLLPVFGWQYNPVDGIPVMHAHVPLVASSLQAPCVMQSLYVQV